MSRKFRYYAEAEEVRRYIEALGYQTEETYTRDGKGATGFAVRDATVDVSYDLVLRHPVTDVVATVGYGLITLWEGVYDTAGDVEKLNRSRKLYEKLYRRFRRR